MGKTTDKDHHKKKHHHKSSSDSPYKTEKKEGKIKHKKEKKDKKEKKEKKEKKDKSERRHSKDHSTRRNDQIASSSSRSNNDLPNLMIVNNLHNFPNITIEDYFLKSQEFRVWLKTVKNR